MENISRLPPLRRFAGLAVAAGILCASLSSSAATNTVSMVTQIMIDTSGASLPDGVRTNISFYTQPSYAFPPTGTDYPEVQALFQKDVFKDVFDEEHDTPLRRFEIEFAISLPAVLLLNTLLLKCVGAIQTGDFNASFDRTREIYLYASALLISGGIAWQDYEIQKRKRESREIRVELYKRKF